MVEYLRKRVFYRRKTLITISIVIPNFNGRNIIPPLLEQIPLWKLNCEVIVVDDASTDDSVDFIQKNYPFVKVIRHSQNQGFTETANDGVKAAKNSKILLLNNDVLLKQGQIEALFSLLEKNPDTFMVSPVITANKEDRVYSESQMKFYWQKGIFFFHYERSPEPAEFLIYATGAACAFLKDKFLELNGYDSLFKPGYYEDMDLCFKAFTKGWRIRLESSVRFEHAVSSTFSKIMPHHRQLDLATRNWWLIHWLWLPPRPLFQHILWVPYHLLWYIKHRQAYKIKSFLKALGRLLRVIQRRQKYQIKSNVFLQMIGQKED
jgi:GT2 family glycosyltransferase